jgi:basic membrane protein A
MLVLALAGCSFLQNADREARAEPVSGDICLVTDTQGIQDRSFNATAWKGVMDAEQELGITGVYLESPDNTYYEPNIQAFIDGGCDLIITVGYLIGDATKKAALENPNQLFAIVDYDFVDLSQTPPADVTYANVKELTFKTDEAAFLAGYLAAGVTRTGIVGAYGGVDIPTVTIFMDGFALGVEHYNRRHGTQVVMMGWDPVIPTGVFTGTFDDVQEGATLGKMLIDERADIIMPVAGGVGLGTAAAAMEEGGIYIIGVDTDWTKSAPEFRSIILTSVLKNMDRAVLQTAREVEEGRFEGGLYVGTLANRGVGLAPYHDLAGIVPPGLDPELSEIREEIIDGEIELDPTP